LIRATDVHGAKKTTERVLEVIQRKGDCDLAQSRDDLIRGSPADLDCAFQITLGVDGSVFATETDAVLRLSFDSYKAGVLGLQSGVFRTLFLVSLQLS